MLTSGEMADLKKKSSTRSRAYIRPRKNGVLLLAGLCATRDTLRLFHGPIYPTYSWLIEFGFRTAVQLADRHHLLSWDELRHIFPKLKSPKRGADLPVELGEGLKGKFIRYISIAASSG